MSIKDNIYSYFTGKYIEGETDLDRLGTPALLKIFRKNMTDYLSAFHPPRLNKSQEKSVRDYYARYSKTDLIYHRVYTDWHGEFHAEYMPDDLYYGKIEPYFCDRLFSKNIDNKCYYPLFFSSAPQPKTYAMRIGGKWLDGNYSFIDMDRLFSIIKEEDEAVLKRATFSQGGHGILFLSGKDKLEKLREAIQENNADLIIQASVKQHPVFEELHPGSVNTLRFMSLLSKDGVKIFARAVRIGRGNARVDNFSSGGLFCGVTEDGYLMDRAVSGDGRSFRTHPDIGYAFAGKALPGCDRAEELIKKAHGIMAHCRIISWDIAIDHKGDALLIEPNLSLGIINAMQACSGPLFGQETRKILEEVFFDKKAKGLLLLKGQPERNAHRLLPAGLYPYSPAVKACSQAYRQKAYRRCAAPKP